LLNRAHSKLGLEIPPHRSSKPVAMMAIAALHSPVAAASIPAATSLRPR